MNILKLRITFFKGKTPGKFIKISREKVSLIKEKGLEIVTNFGKENINFDIFYIKIV